MNKTSSVITPFRSSWYSFGLGEARPCKGTYCLYPMESLPPISESLLQGTFHWLIPLDYDMKRQEQQYYFSEEEYSSVTDETAKLEEIKILAQQLRIPLPAPFLSLMASAQLLNRIPSCTDCFFELSKQMVPCPGSEHGYIIRFLNTSQWLNAWYLYVTPQGEHCVLVADPWLDLLNDPEYSDSLTEEERRRAFDGKHTYVCAQSFEEFIYRFWLKNIIWYKYVWFKGEKPLTGEEQRYLSHYMQRKDQN
jgi:hypothetical protein